MAFKEPNDDELERLFQAGAEQYNFEYDPIAWSQMETLLHSNKKRRVLYYALLVLLLLSLIGLFILGSYDANERDLQKTTNKEITSIDKKLKPSSQEFTNAIPPENVQDSPTPPKSKTSSPQLINSSTTENSNAQIQNTNSNASNYTSINKEKENATNFLNITSEPKNEKSKLITNSRQNQNTTIQNGKRSDFQKITQKESSHFFDLTFLDRKDISPLTLNSSLSDIYELRIVDVVHQERQSKTWYLGATFGTETSVTNEKGYSSYEPNYGIETGVFLGRHFGLRLDATYIKDEYVAGKSDYIPPKGYWSNGVAPDQTFANCNMIKLGIGMQYFLSNSNSSGFYGGLDVTSFFMLKEDYYYMYGDATDNWGTVYWNENNTLFNGLEFNVGYNKYISNRFILSIEPYARIPIQGIGHGNIMLGGAGIRVVTKWISAK